uniref:Pentatricopeptide repeat-containing protein n=1 Tax=Oryza barthii TaxID=65489 RepID=A0A0D3H382_9ORYZ
MVCRDLGTWNSMIFGYCRSAEWEEARHLLDAMRQEGTQPGVKSGTLFDNILITDDPEYAKKFAEETWAKHKDAEKTAFDEAEKRRLEEDDEDEADDDKADVVAEQTKDSDDEKPQDIKVSADEKPNSSKYDSSLCEEG